MSLKVLWFEDNLQNFDKIIPNLEEHTSKFHQKIFEYHHSEFYPADFDVKLFEGNYNLAFIDLNLGNGQKGVDIINVLREKGAFIDVLLYSNNPQELIKLTEGANYIEGIFRHATMNGIEEKMKNVIDQILYKEMMAIIRNQS